MKHDEDKPRPVRRAWGRMSLRWRILTYLLLFTALILAMLWLFQVVYLDEFYEVIRTSQLEQATDEVAEDVDSPELASIATGVGQRRNICISVYTVDDNGWIYSLQEAVRVDIQGSCIIHHLGESMLRSFYENTVAGGGYYRENIPGSSFHVKVEQEDTPLRDRLQGSQDFRLPDSLVIGRIVQGEENTYFLLLNSTIAPVTATVSILRVQLLYISLMLIAMMVLLSALIAFWLSRPLVKITGQAQRLATGDFSVKFDGAGYQETAELADSLNYAASELGKSEKLQQDILANISHDLRTPLTMIGGYAELMRDFPDDDYSESLDVIIDETQRMTRLVTDVLDLSRISAGVQQLDQRLFDLSDLLRSLVHNYNHLIEPDGYRVELTIDQDVVICGDEVRLQQAVGNMLNNALTHCGEDKLILVSQQTEGDKVRVTIADHGHGIDPDDLPHIWERYYHADAPQRAAKGSGLGLSIVKGILELHQADFGVESQPGQGSAFWFQLPLPPEEEPAPDKAKDKPKKEHKDKK